MLIKEVPRIQPNTQNLANYVLAKATSISGNIPVNMGNINESAKSIETDFNSRLTSKQKSNEMHYVISFEESHEDIIDEKMLMVGRELVKRHFGDNRNFLLAIHRDTDYPHLHLIMENRDFDNKAFFKKDNYRSLENLAQKLEKKYSLKNEQISESRNDPSPVRLNYASKQYESRTGQESDEKKYKNELKGLLSSAQTPEALFRAMIEEGFTIRANKSKTDPKKLTGYYINKSSISIKPSSIGFQVSKLAQKFHVDEDGIERLILQFEGSPPPDSAGEIRAVPGPYKPKTNRRQSLYTNFQTTDGVNYTSKNERYKSSFSVRQNGVTFTNPNEVSIKAGIQALLENGSKGPFQVTGSTDFKRKAWLVSAMMGLEVSNYTPTQTDLKALYNKVKAHQEKYPTTKINILRTHLEALQKEGLELDMALNREVSFADLFPSARPMPEPAKAIPKSTPVIKPPQTPVSKQAVRANESAVDKAIEDIKIDEFLRSQRKSIQFK
ncbi:relaxase/mobilization nuclease domain-containing protein [Pseudomonas typographi]|uniref:relaxase/mobilization nuclease domain-containing protein n=1 Tax=Pseudomonas typographi TaxID=2715964 RepID=UPI0016871207|nr:relaxase/mobilization nuclease domain-containing protein [Pseudomonas typographi]MBD1586006.1 relaxase/mobilization nuclease domain-containing protein [Pseudomonas typographi]